MIEIGGYILDKDEMTLSRDGNSVKLEPKVLDVLIYFCKNKKRYISMTELHENVWQNRCVSDAAVRRSIGKLRQLFKDDHKAPTFIQSLPKRGYKLICQVSNFDDENNIIETSAFEEQFPSNDKDNISNSLLTKLLQCKNSTMLMLLVMVIALFFIAPIYYGVYEKIALLQPEHQVIINNIEQSLS